MSQNMPFSDLFMQTLTFSWQKFGTVFKAMLLPIVIVLIGIIALGAALLDFQYLADFEEHVPAGADDVGGVLAAFAEIFRVDWKLALIIFIGGTWLFSLPMYSAYARLSRFIGLGETPQSWWLPALDGPTWRMFFAYLIYGFLTWVMYGIGFVIAYAMNGNIFQNIGELANFEYDPTVALPFVGFFMTAFLIGFVGHIIMGTKLAPFTAASACENRLMLINSWVRTKGHFWTILGTYILLTLTLMAISTMIELVNMVLTVLTPFLGSAGMVLLVIATLIYIVATIIYQFFAIGVMVAFPAYIYRYLWRE